MNPHLPHLQKQAAKAPTSPGVYRWLSEDGEILYVGKAKNLRNRVKSYVQKKPDKSLGPWKLALVEKIADVDVTVTNSELEALVLETNLIKEHKPKYNVMMKDDKNYVYVEVTVQDAFPCIDVVRQMKDKKARYFGPYTKKYEIERLLDLVNDAVQFRSDNATLQRLNRAARKDELDKELNTLTKETPPLEYQIGNVNALCIGELSQAAYKERIDQLIQFLQGDHTATKQRISERMQTAAMNRKFEEAARLRDALKYIELMEEKQIVSDTSGEDADFLALALYGTKGQVLIMQERGGKIMNEYGFALKGEIDNRLEALEQCITQYYSEAGDVPGLILIEEDIAERELLEEWLQEIRGKKVEIRIPERGKKRQLMTLARTNAEQKMKQQEAKWETAARNAESALQELQETLQLPELPKRIEGYDISHMGGLETVGSMVVTKNGKAASDQYRSFTIQSLKEGQIDDYSALQEVMKRRLKYLIQDLKREEKEWKEQGISFGRMRKKEQEVIDQLFVENKPILSTLLMDYSTLLIARKEDAIVGLVRLAKHSSNVIELKSLWLQEEYRGKKLGQFLVRKLLHSIGKGKVYVRVEPSLVPYYNDLGFRHVHTPPTVLQKDMAKRQGECEGIDYEVMIYVFADHKKDSSLTTRPDLIVIDGGKGQLSSVVEVMTEMNCIIPIIGLAKREEEVFVPRNPDPVIFTKDSQAKFLLMRLRNEAHRFANKLRESKGAKRTMKSALDDIEGIGPETKKKLLQKFGSLQGIKDAEDEDVLTVVNKIQLGAIRSL